MTFADDIADSEEHLQRMLYFPSHWCSQNKMSVNISKPKLFKYLGVILNEFVDLDFTETALKDRLDEQENTQTSRLTGIYLYMYYNVINNVCVYIYAKGKKLC